VLFVLKIAVLPLMKLLARLYKFLDN
jgi:hypothetical protein